MVNDGITSVNGIISSRKLSTPPIMPNAAAKKIIKNNGGNGRPYHIAKFAERRYKITGHADKIEQDAEEYIG